MHGLGEQVGIKAGVAAEVSWEGVGPGCCRRHAGPTALLRLCPFSLLSFIENFRTMFTVFFPALAHEQDDFRVQENLTYTFLELFCFE